MMEEEKYCGVVVYNDRLGGRSVTFSDNEAEYFNEECRVGGIGNGICICIWSDSPRSESELLKLVEDLK